jgi:hypothetical protein
MVMDIDSIITNNKKLFGYNKEPCACKGCTNVATTVLEVKYIQKVGYFCSPCAEELLQSELVLNKSTKKGEE